jgi:DNA repair protein RadC
MKENICYENAPGPDIAGLSRLYLIKNKIANFDFCSLTDDELITLFLSFQFKEENISVLAARIRSLLDKNDSLTVTNLTEIPGITLEIAYIIMAAFEYSKRKWGLKGHIIKEPHDIFMCIRHLWNPNQERFIAISLNGSRQIINIRIIAVGFIDRVFVHPREVFADIITDRASAFICAHNHPSNSCIPSSEDNDITKRLANTADILKITFLDHIIFTEDKYYSYRQERSVLLNSDINKGEYYNGCN